MLWPFHIFLGYLYTTELFSWCSMDIKIIALAISHFPSTFMQTSQVVFWMSCEYINHCSRHFKNLQDIQIIALQILHFFLTLGLFFGCLVDIWIIAPEILDFLRTFMKSFRVGVLYTPPHTPVGLQMDSRWTAPTIQLKLCISWSSTQSPSGVCIDSVWTPPDFRWSTLILDCLKGSNWSTKFKCS